MILSRLTLFLLLVSLCSCLKEDKPLTLPPKGNGAMIQLNMGENYDLQYFVNLRTNEVVHSSKIDDWDLAFQCGDNDFTVLLNGGKGMAASPFFSKSFQSISANDTSGLGSRWKIDLPCGTNDSLVMGAWVNQKPVYFIRRDKLGKEIVKLQMLQVDAFAYTFRFGGLNDTGKLYTIYKRPEFNFVYFSIDDLAEVNNIEPPKTNWDIVTTLYSAMFYDQNPPLAYVVNGFLLNPTNTKAYHDSIIGFQQMDAVKAATLPFQERWDAIGYLWKSYDLNTNIYTAKIQHTYVVKAQNGAMFKLRFLDFYSPQGIKGSPKFEFVPL